MRRLLASTLLVLFLFPLAAPVFGMQAAEDALPPCCRRGGKHYAAMVAMMANMQGMAGRSIQTAQEKCPYSIAPPAILVPPPFTPSPAASVFSGIMRHPSVSPQTEALFRVSFTRSSQKRGPPAPFI